jgi:hypothetical protein
MPEDRCHLSGLAVVLRHRTRPVGPAARVERDPFPPWRANGDAERQAPARKYWYAALAVRVRRHHVPDPGPGLRVDPDLDTAEPLAEWPGFDRGLDRLGDILFVGLSRIRDRPGGGPPIAVKPETLVFVSRRWGGGRAASWPFWHGGMLGIGDDPHRRAQVLPGRAFWCEETAEE